jgi:ABC-type sugar transport system permease subunit
MATLTSTSGRSSPDSSLLWTVLKLFGLMLFNSLALIFVYTFLHDGNLPFAIVFGLIAIGANIIIFVPRLYPIRWMLPGLMMVTLLVIFPIAYTVQTAFTNYGDGHLYTKQQAISLIERSRGFISPDALQYSWELYQAEWDLLSYALWMTPRGNNDQPDVLFAPMDAPIEIVEDAPEEAPETYNGYVRLPSTAKADDRLLNLVFGEDEDTVGIANTRIAARPLTQRYLYNAENDTISDVSTGLVYVADDVNGAFVIPRGGRGDAVTPGYRVDVGLHNFSRLINEPGLRGPLIEIFIWTVMFALFSVLTTFTVGLFMAMILNDPGIPGRKIIRSLLIIPYALPGVIGILVWRGMLNQNLGIITNFINDMTGVRIPWFTDQTWAKIAIIMVNLWLGYPYMMLICSGALQAIPSEVYEAAAVDGANPMQRFWRITLPLLLITVGPLLIASFVFNFNNYLLIELLTRGDPPIPGSPVPAGYTDILISYTYGVAFGSNRGADYGYAASITIVIFLIVATITLIQYRFTKQLEEISENV